MKKFHIGIIVCGASLCGALTLALVGGCGGEPAGRVPPPAAEPTTAQASSESGAMAAESGAAAATTTTTTAAPAVSGSVRITGTIKFSGAAPKMPVIQMGADPICMARHKTPITGEALVLGADNAMANVFVRIKSGLPSKAWPTPSEPVVLDQNGCHYTPHVFAVMVGQKLVIKNPDGTLHNVHALCKVNPEFNIAMPKNRTEAEKVFDKAEDIFQIKCDVHPWMGGWMAVTDNPFYAVSGMNGKYEIRGDLPAGSYEIEAWHEKLGVQTAKVTVPASGSVTQDFTFARPNG